MSLEPSTQRPRFRPRGLPACSCLDVCLGEILDCVNAVRAARNADGYKKGSLGTACEKAVDFNKFLVTSTKLRRAATVLGSATRSVGCLGGDNS